MRLLPLMQYERKGKAMLRKRDKGMLEHFLPALVTIVLMAVLWTGSMVSASNIDRSSNIHHVARTYMLKMETDGYLTPENESALRAELRALGIREIDLTGTSLTDVGYGNEVRLRIKGNVMLIEIEFKGFAAPMMTEKVTEVSVSKVSVAKN